MSRDNQQPCGTRQVGRQVGTPALIRLSAYLLSIGLAALLWLFAPAHVQAQGCGCDHTIAATETFVDATKLAKPVIPGQTICLTAGRKDFLRLENFRGSAAKYLTFKNCGGQVLVQNSPRGFGFVMNNCQYFKLTGTGDKQVKYGFKVDGTPQGASGLIFGEKSSDFEVEYIEVMRTGFAGIIGKTDPNCSRVDMRSFVMRNVHFHHNYIHDTGGEGFYIGYFAFPTRVVQCNGVDTTLYPHPIENVSIHHNILKNNGWDAIQLGSAPKQASIHHNLVENYATANETFQQSGIQLNAGAAADIYNNILIKGTGQGLAIFGYGGSKVYNNLIVDAGADGIYVNDKSAQTTKSYVIANNTIVRPARYGIGLAAQTIKDNLIYNNLIVAPGDFPKSGSKSYISFLSPAANYKLAGNLNIETLAQAMFVDPSKADYHLKPGASAIDKGVAVASLGITQDLEDQPRDVPAGKVDVGAYEYQSAPPCKDGDSRVCNTTGRQGKQTCANGKWGTCTPNPTEPPPDTTSEASQEPPTGDAGTPVEPTQTPDNHANEQVSTEQMTPDSRQSESTSKDQTGSTTDTTQRPDPTGARDNTTSTGDQPGQPSPDTASTTDNPETKSGCGCNAGSTEIPFMALLWLLFWIIFHRRTAMSNHQ